MTIKRAILTFFLCILVTHPFAEATKHNDSLKGIPEININDNNKKIVFLFEINQDIFPAVWRIVKQAVTEAENMHADILFIKMNTYGGMVNIADSIRTIFLNTKLLTIVFINKNAASAGALISIACDSIYMAKGATIGAATVVNQSGEKMPDKYQSYMRGIMRSTAEAQGRNPKIAEAMVDEKVEIKGIIDSESVLTFTTSEAIQHGFCEGEANSVQEVLTKANIEDYEIVKFVISPLEKIISFLLNPILSGLLLMVIVGGIYFELQPPGIGFPLAAAFTAAILYFAPLYLEGLAQHWELLLFLVGIILILLEIFVIPGFGIAGISGITLLFTSLILSLVRNDFFDFTFVPPTALIQATIRVFTPIILTFILMVIFGKNIFKSRMFQQLVLQSTQQASEGYTVNALNADHLIGKRGKTITPLYPSGKVEIEGTLYDASTDGEYIEKDKKVMVSEIKSNYLVVNKT